MLIYLLYMVMPVLIWFGFSVFSKQSIGLSESIRKRYIAICGVVLFLIIALRHHAVGSGDGTWYYLNWKYLSNVSFDTYLKIYGRFDIENGYLLSIWFLSHILKDPQYLFVIYGLLVAFSVSRFVYKNCDNPVIGFVMFNALGLWGFMVQGIRQGVAMCICLFAIEACKQRKFVKFIAIVAVAMLFHASAIVFIAVYPLSLIKMNLQGYVTTIVVAVIALMLIEPIFDVINVALNDMYEVGDVETTSGGFVSVAIYVIIIVATLILFINEKNVGTEVSMFFYITFCGMIIFLMRFFANSISMRAAYYYMFGQIILLPTIINKKLGRYGVYVNMLVVVLCVGIALYKASYSTLVPYYFFWQ